MTALREWVRDAIRTPQRAAGAARPGRARHRRACRRGPPAVRAAGCDELPRRAAMWTSAIIDYALAAGRGRDQRPRRRRTAADRQPGRGASTCSASSCVTSARSTSACPARATRSAPTSAATRDGDRGLRQRHCSVAPLDALGIDYNGDGKGNGYNLPSLLGIVRSPPYYHNGACEKLACVVGDPKHRTALGVAARRAR